MGNDIFSAFINKKKSMNIHLAEIFFKYTVNDKNKLNKTLEKIIDIYINLFYFSKKQDISKLEKYFTMKNSNDNLLKEILLSTIIFYKDNDLEENIEKDIGTIIILSNTIYLSLILGDINKYDVNLIEFIDSFFVKYKNKIRIKNDKVEDLKKELVNVLKINLGQFKKFYKLFDEMQYSIQKEKILDFNDGYMINLLTDIKLLSKFSKNEIEQTKNNRGLILDENIIALELIVLEVIKDILSNSINNKYFIEINLTGFEKLKYKQAIDTIFKNEFLKEKIVLVFNYEQVKKHQTIIENLKNNNFILATNKIDDIKVTKNSFDNIKYVFVPSLFLEYYDGYLEIWKAKNIEFIVSGGYHE